VCVASGTPVVTSRLHGSPALIVVGEDDWVPAGNESAVIDDDLNDPRTSGTCVHFLCACGEARDFCGRYQLEELGLKPATRLEVDARWRSINSDGPRFETQGG